MDSSEFAAGDNKVSQSLPLRHVDEKILHDENHGQLSTGGNSSFEAQTIADEGPTVDQSDFTTQAVEDNELKLKERIAQCRSIIESLKIELNEEKTKLEKQKKSSPRHTDGTTSSQYVCNTEINTLEMGVTPSMYSECVDSKLICDESLIQYEKQLQKYQDTLNMAQIEKKNAIRRHMMAKAYRLKLLEVENQCNIELLRVKQSLQCLQPLQMIASKWKTSSADEIYDFNHLDLIPRYQESDAVNMDIKFTPSKLENYPKEDISSD